MASIAPTADEVRTAEAFGIRDIRRAEAEMLLAWSAILEREVITFEEFVARKNHAA